MPEVSAPESAGMVMRVDEQQDQQQQPGDAPAAQADQAAATSRRCT